MNKSTILIVLLSVAALPMLLGAGADRRNAVVAGSGDGRAHVVTVESVQPEAPEVIRPDAGEVSAAPAAMQMDWISVNSGGAIGSQSASYKMGVTVGQAATGQVASPGFQMVLGFWSVVAGGAGACPIAMTGDVNINGSITASDIIAVVNYVFKGGDEPQPCVASADVSCDGSVTAADIIALVNYVFKGGDEPCDVCSVMPGLWTCP